MRKLLFLILPLLFFACAGDKNTFTAEYFKVSGETMGTTYKVIYEDVQGRNFKASFDSLLLDINEDVNTYDPNSIISKFNTNTISDSLWAAENVHYDENMKLALEIAAKTEGAFDPTIMPVVNHWGFGYTGKEPVTQIDTLLIDSIMQFVGYELLEWTEPLLGEDGRLSIMKMDGDLKLDFGGIAKGYALDKVAELLDNHNVSNYMVEIGLEVKAKGKNPDGLIWKIGINTPKEGAAITDIEEIVNLDNLSVATSGNYRQSYEVDGRKMAHIINPKTGYPEVTNLLSVSVFHQNCAMADAYATSFIVMGLDKALKFAEETAGMEALFIYGKEDGSLGLEKTTGMNSIILE